MVARAERRHPTLFRLFSKLRWRREAMTFYDLVGAAVFATFVLCAVVAWLVDRGRSPR